jgi:hypothetical protein
MGHKELVEYVKKVRKMGYKDEHIISHLKSNGYPDEVILRVFDDINKKFDKVLMIMAVVFGILVLAVLVYVGMLGLNSLNIMKANSPCNTAGISIYYMGDQSSLCMSQDGTKLMLMVSNSGQQNISRLVYIVKGDKSSTTTDMKSLNIPKGGVFPIIIQYEKSKQGEFRDIEISPTIRLPKREMGCGEKKIAANSYRIC